MKKVIVILGFLLVLLPARSQEVTYKITNSVLIENQNCELNKLIVLLPVPQTNIYQTVHSFDPGEGHILDDDGTGNKYWRQIIEGDKLPESGENYLSFYEMEITLKPVEFDLDTITREFEYDKNTPVYLNYTGSDSTFIAPDHPVIQDIADQLWKNSNGYIDYARASFKHVLENYKYSVPHWGLLPIDVILSRGGGNYANLCSILISLLRNKGIPARHVFSVRTDRSVHIWVDFYLEKYGWIPIDLSYEWYYHDRNYFGYCHRDGVVMLTGATYLLEKDSGVKYLQTWFQNFNWWYWSKPGPESIQAAYSLKVIDSTGQTLFPPGACYYISPFIFNLSLGETSKEPIILIDETGNRVFKDEEFIWYYDQSLVSVSHDGYVTALQEEPEDKAGTIIRCRIKGHSGVNICNGSVIRIIKKPLEYQPIVESTEHIILSYPDKIVYQNYNWSTIAHTVKEIELMSIMEYLYQNFQWFLNSRPSNSCKLVYTTELVEPGSLNTGFTLGSRRLSLPLDLFLEGRTFIRSAPSGNISPYYRAYIMSMGYHFFIYCPVFRLDQSVFTSLGILNLVGIEALIRMLNDPINYSITDKTRKSIQGFILADTTRSISRFKKWLNDGAIPVTNNFNDFLIRGSQREETPGGDDWEILCGLYLHYRNKVGEKFSERFFKAYQPEYNNRMDTILSQATTAGQSGSYTVFAALISAAYSDGVNWGIDLSQEFKEKYNFSIIQSLFDQAFPILKEIMNEGQEKVIDPKARLIRIIIILSGIIMLGALIWISFAIRSRVKRKQLEEKKKKMELELRAIRSQMNPHFMFNSLSSIQNLINSGKIKNANIYLSKFATLMRSILNNSREEFIPLNIEIETLKTYFELESLRFNFDHSITIDPAIDVFNTEIPGLIVQPYVENAIVHGIAPMEERGRINVDIRKVNKHLLVTIEDNGVGIKSGNKKKRSHKGVGMTISQERLELLNQNKGENWDVKTIDKSDLPNQGTGTIVKITIPLDN